MKKWLLIGCIDRNICEPKVFNSYKEAYKAMENILIEEIYKTENEDEYLTKKGKLKTTAELYDFEIDVAYMYSNLDENYPIDFKIFEIDL